MKTIYEFMSEFGIYRGPLYRGDVGIEIETESRMEYVIPKTTFWRADRDGSLRDFGIEYILKEPVSVGKELDAALDEFKNKTKDFKFIEDSISTSVHVHLNFLNNKWIDVANFLTTYYILENLLIRASGPDRLSNLFCLPICDAQGCVDLLRSFMTGVSRMSRKPAFGPENGKYAALNLCNMYKLGTLEVRTMRGVTDTDIIRKWVNILYAIKRFSEREGLLPFDILEIFHKTDQEFLHEVFHDRSLREFLDIPDKGQLMRDNLWYGKMVASMCNAKDDTWGFPKPKKIVREKLRESLNAHSMELFGVLFSDLPFYQKMVVEERVSEILGIEHRLIFNTGDE